MEVALVPVAGTRLLAPFRVSVVSMLANLVIKPTGSKPLRDHWAPQRFLNRRRLSETHALSI